MAHRDQALVIFGPNGELLDGSLDGADFIGRVNEANKGRWRSPEAANLPSGNASLLSLTFTLTHPSAEYRWTRRGIRVVAAAVYASLERRMSSCGGPNRRSSWFSNLPRTDVLRGIFFDRSAPLSFLRLVPILR